MILLNPENMRAIANELNYMFFISDDRGARWNHVSIPFLRLLKLSEKEVEENPAVWQTKVSCPPETLEDMLGSLSQKRDSVLLRIPFLEDSCSEVFYLAVRFSGLIEFEDGNLYRLGSAEIETEDTHYKQEALKAKDNEIEISARIQKTLLTGDTSLSLGEIEIAAESLPSREVDGDFYEILRQEPHLVDFIIGDVMGKGVPAALLAAAVKASYFKSLITCGITLGKQPGIEAILRRMDSLINKDLMELNKFLTLYYCRIDRADSLLSFIDAGHTGFIYYNGRDGVCWHVKGSNMPLGFTTEQDYRVFTLPFEEKDLFFFYSDGITEVKNSEGIMFGTERLAQLIRSHCYLSAEELLKKILNVTFFFATEPFEDDITGISIKIDRAHRKIIHQGLHSLSPGGDSSLDELREDIMMSLEKTYEARHRDDCHKLVISLMEACANCLSHARSDITLEWWLLRSRAEISIRYVGEDYEWFRSTPPSVDEYQKSGYGLYLINQGTDSSLLLKGTGNQKKLVLLKEFM